MRPSAGKLMNCLKKLTLLFVLDINGICANGHAPRLFAAKDLHAHGSACLLPTHVRCAHQSVLAHRLDASGAAQGQGLLLSGSVLRLGLRTTDGARLFAQHRTVPTVGTRPVVSHGPALQRPVAQCLGQCQRDATRPWQVFAELAQHLMATARVLYAHDK